MKFAFIISEVDNTGGVRGTAANASILIDAGHEVDVYSKGMLNGGCNEWTHKTIPYTSENLFIFDFSTYDLIVSFGLSSLYEVKKINHPKKVHFCQMYDKFLHPYGEIDKLYDNTTFIVHNNPLRDILLANHKCKVIKIPYGIEVDKYKPFRNSNKNFSRPEIVFITSYYSVLKDMSLMQYVFDKMMEHGWITKLITPQPKHFQSSEYIHNPSFEKKCSIIANATILLHTSKFETWSRAIMESMALGTPVVGTNSHGPKEYANSKNSVLLDDRDPSAICSAILDLYHDKLKYFSTIQNAYSTVESYRWDNISDAIVKTYVELAT